MSIMLQEIAEQPEALEKTLREERQKIERLAVTLKRRGSNVAREEMQTLELVVQEDGELYCLNCRRELAAEVQIEEAGEDVSSERRTQIRSRARVEFEIKRDPERQDSAIAKACRTSTFSVRKARARLAGDSEDED